MLWRRFAMTGLALGAALLTLISASSLAHAAPSATYGPPKEGTKVVLADTSIDGPAIMATYAPETVLAWTGTDSGRHINLMTSSDGLHYGNKITLPESSLWRPAIAFIDSGRGAPYGTIVLAWTGTDAKHTLNIEFLKMPGYSVVQKVTLWGEWSFTAPAISSINGDVNSDIYLSWAGTDPAHTLNVIHRTTNPETQSKHILWGWSSVSRPNLDKDLSSSAVKPLLMSWTGVNHRIYFASSSDGAIWSEPSASPLTYQSVWAPSMIGFHSTALPTHWLAWTGDGSAGSRRITVKYTQNFPTWSDAGSQTTLSEWAISSPELTYNSYGTENTLLLAWTGTDDAHHLNVATITV
ncbi:MAG TPA: hypothetical protein VF808_11130 [Ktedonobacterales bacterium]